MSYMKLLKWATAIVVLSALTTATYFSATSPWGFSVEYFLRRLIPILVLAYVLFATRRRPGARYVKKPPTKADADLDNWTGWG